MNQNSIKNMVKVLATECNIPVPTCTFNLKGRTAGQYWPAEHTIRFNMEIAENYPDLYAVTVIHEMAHALDFASNGGRKDSSGRWIHHDALFYGYCASLHYIAYTKGLVKEEKHEYKRTHNYDVKPSRKFREFEYECGCKDHTGKLVPHVVKTPTHNKLQKGWQYGCRACGQTFTSKHFLREKK